MKALTRCLWCVLLLALATAREAQEELRAHGEERRRRRVNYTVNVSCGIMSLYQVQRGQVAL